MVVELIHVHEDQRGFIKAIKGLLEGDKEFAFLEVKQGNARGGCCHTEDECLAVIDGKINLTLGDREEVLVKGQSKIIPKNTVHAFIGLENSIVSEWGITTQEKQKDIKDPKLRALVDEINKRSSDSLNNKN